MLTFACLLAGLVAPLSSALEWSGQESSAQEREQSEKIAWFEGTWEELLAEAKASNRLIFLDLWTPWCPYCRKLEKVTFRSSNVAASLKDLLCFSANVEDPKNAELARRFKPKPPTLAFLEPDGRLRDLFVGEYLAPDPFRKEVERIKRNEGTFSALRDCIEKDPEDFDARYELALKLERIGDHKGYKEQIHTIRKLDPEGRSLPSRRLRLVELHQISVSRLELDELYAFLEEETEPELLFIGWLDVWSVERTLTRVSREPERSKHRQRALAAARSLWPHVPRERWPREGNNIAWSYYEDRAHLSAEDLSWALDVAKAVAEAAPREAYVIDTLACCLYAAGKRKDAIKAARRCIELDPYNPKWKERLIEFSQMADQF